MPLTTLQNKTVVCQDPYGYNPGNFLGLHNPLKANLPLLLLQLSLIALTAQFLHFCLKPLGQSIIVSQVLSGILFGPSVLGHQKTLEGILFPSLGFMVMDTVASFGLMFFFFVIGVRTNSISMFKIERKARVLAITLFVVSLSVPIALSLVLKKYVSMDEDLASALPIIALSQSFCSFPVIACLINELKFQNTDVGKLSLNIAGLFDPAGIVINAIFFSLLGNNSGEHYLQALWQLLSTFAVMAFIVFIMRPIIIWIFELTKEGDDSVHEICIFTVFVCVLLTGLGTELVGQHHIMGPLVLGLAIPNEPPLGAALVDKLETLMFQIFYPTYLAANGLHTNLSKIQFQASWTVGLIVVVSFFIKIVGVMVPAHYLKMNTKDAFLVGLAMNGKGIVELALCSFWRHAKVLSEREFSISVLVVVILTAIIAPLMKLLYNPSDRYFSLRRCTIEHSKRDAELRLMICIHNIENVPTAINLLEASHASEESRLSVTLMMLEELVGRDKPILIAHQSQTLPDKESSNTKHVLKAIHQYELQNQGHANVRCFTSISKYETMRDDICMLGMNFSTAMIILSFHKQWAIDGSVESVNAGIQAVNIEVLKSAPCSVGLLIDRRILNESKSILTTRMKYRIAVLYIGGVDDAEALAYGSRMAKHLQVEVTVVQFLLFGAENSKLRKHNSDLLHEYRTEHAGNGRFVIMEQVLKDSLGLTSCITRMKDCFELMIVGREHIESPLFKGLEQWSQYPELGVMGDMLVSQDFGIKASVLVVQQQKIRGKLVSHMTHRTANDIQNRSCNITVDRYV